MPKLKIKNKKQNSPLRKKLKNTSLLKPEPKKHLNFIPSGSWMLNLALTNNIDHGYPIGRVINPIGGYSSGKTLLACEAVNAAWYIYHKKMGKKVKIYYDEPETAFDLDLARGFNMPLEEIIGLRERLPGWKKTKDDFKASRQIEDMYNNIMRIVKEEAEKYDLILYIMDSLDAVTDAREIKHIEKKGVGSQDYAGKPGVLSQMFRTCIQSINNSNMILYIVSQIRANIGVTFGKQVTRSAGKALDHYASQIFWLYEREKINSKNGFNQGTKCEVEVDKNKTGSRYNNVKFDILHGYGIDNYGSAVDFLWNKGGFEKSGNYIEWINGKKYYQKELINKAAEDEKVAQQLKQLTQKHWNKLLSEAKINRKPKWG